jgi:signal transduction histidine kinase
LSQVSRESIHDLRNLFGILASAGRLLSDLHPAPNAVQLLDAIDDAAARGDRLTTQLLSQRATAASVESVDLNRRIVEMEPMLMALLEPGIELTLDLCEQELPIRLEAMALEAAVIELVMNARSVSPPLRRLVLRTRRAGTAAWFTVADDGPGLPSYVRRRLADGRRAIGAHGTGLLRVKAFARESQGRLLIRSAHGRGTVISLILPTASGAVFGERAAVGRQFPQPKEMIDEEERQPVAA